MRWDLSFVDWITGDPLMRNTSDSPSHCTLSDSGALHIGAQAFHRNENGKCLPHCHAS